MSGSTSVEKNNAYVACTEIKAKEKEKELSIEIGNYGQKGQDAEYEIKIINGKIVTSDDRAEARLKDYNKNREKDIRKYGKTKTTSESKTNKGDEEPQI